MNLFKGKEPDELEKYSNWMKYNRLARYCMLSTMPDETKEKYMINSTKGSNLDSLLG